MKTKGSLPICIVPLMDVNERRRENLKTLLAELDITMAEVNRRTGVAASYIGSSFKQLPDGRYIKNIGEKTARKLEKGLGKPEGWLDLAPPQYKNHQGTSSHALQENSAPYGTPGMQVARAMETLRLALVKVDPLTRAQAKPIIDALFQDPENAQHLGQRMTITLGISETPSSDRKTA